VSDLVWITNPALPGQDLKVPRNAIGVMYAPGGWHIREDQSDPVEEDVAAAAAEAKESPAPADNPDDAAAAEGAAADTDDTTKKKGR